MTTKIKRITRIKGRLNGKSVKLTAKQWKKHLAKGEKVVFKEEPTALVTTVDPKEVVDTKENVE